MPGRRARRDCNRPRMYDTEPEKRKWRNRRVRSTLHRPSRSIIHCIPSPPACTAEESSKDGKKRLIRPTNPTIHNLMFDGKFHSLDDSCPQLSSGPFGVGAGQRNILQRTGRINGKFYIDHNDEFICSMQWMDGWKRFLHSLIGTVEVATVVVVGSVVVVVVLMVALVVSGSMASATSSPGGMCGGGGSVSTATLLIATSSASSVAASSLLVWTIVSGIETGPSS